MTTNRKRQRAVMLMMSDSERQFLDAIVEREGTTIRDVVLKALREYQVGLVELERMRSEVENLKLSVSQLERWVRR